MNEKQKIEVEGLIATHKLFAILDRGVSCFATLQGLADGIKSGRFTPEMVCAVVVGVYDEKSGAIVNGIIEMKEQGMEVDVAALFDQLDDMMGGED